MRCGLPKVRLKLDLIAFSRWSLLELAHDGWTESSGVSITWKAACARRVHRQIKKNVISANLAKAARMDWTDRHCRGDEYENPEAPKMESLKGCASVDMRRFV